MRKIAAFALLLALAASTLPAQKAGLSVPLRFDRYYTLDEVYEALRALHRAYPGLTKLETVGTSEEGRPLMALTVNNPKTGAPLDKPGIYVDGNMHGNEIQGGDISLYLLDYLLGGYGKNDELTRLVDRACFYVVPVVNVDGRYHFLADANSPDSNRTLRIPVDDDRDGLVDEDPADDLDGDGNICVMRKRDPFGPFRTDPEDPRLMVRVKPGEKGEWTVLGDEGIDNDGDGRINEDGEGYVDPNRNWGYDWAPPYVQGGSGEFPFSGAGLKGLAEWMMTRTNIVFVWSFHNNGGMILRGPSRKGLGEYPAQDIAVYDYLGKQGERIIPGYRYLISWKDLYTTYGDSGEWATATLGAYFYCAEVFMAEAEAFQGASERPAPGTARERAVSDIFSGGVSERDRIKFSDHVVQGDLYKTWAPVRHPEYGDVEIGGWVKMSSRLGPPFQIKDLVHRNAMAVLFTAKHLPEVSLEIVEVKALGGGLTRVRTRLSNPKAMPTMSALAEKAGLYPRDMLRVSGGKVVAGGQLVDPYRDRVTYKKDRPGLQFLVVPGFGKIEHQFLVEGKGEITVLYESRHGGKLVKTVKID